MASHLYTANSTEDGLPIEEVLSGWTMRRRPELTWKYLGQFEQRCRGARCNRAHEVIAEMERSFDRVWVLTQNVDSFHREAGSHNVIDIHGDLHRLYCTRCGFRQEVPDYSALSIPPRCPDCAGYLRPDVVLFGEMLPLDKVALLEEEMAQGFDVVLSIGTTSIFPYIAGPVHQKPKDRASPRWKSIRALPKCPTWWISAWPWAQRRPWMRSGVDTDNVLETDQPGVTRPKDQHEHP